MCVERDDLYVDTPFQAGKRSDSNQSSTTNACLVADKSWEVTALELVGKLSGT